MWKWFRARLARLGKDEGGFTLVELLVVMIIVGILAGVGVSGYQRFQERAYKTAADSAWRDLQMAINLHEVEEETNFPRGVAGDAVAEAIAEQLQPAPEPLQTNLLTEAGGVPATAGDGELVSGETGFVVGANFTCVWVNGHPSRFNDEVHCVNEGQGGGGNGG